MKRFKVRFATHESKKRWKVWQNSYVIRTKYFQTFEAAINEWHRHSDAELWKNSSYDEMEYGYSAYWGMIYRKGQPL